MAYITWEYYSSLYNEVSEEAEFSRLCSRAEMKLDSFTHMRTMLFMKEFKKIYATDFQKLVYSQVQNAVCELINAIHVQETSGMGTGISGVSNDGYSESYKITTEAEKESQLLSIVRNELSGTGLAGAL